MADLDVRQQNIQIVPAQQAGTVTPANTSRVVNVSDATSSDSLTTGNTSNPQQTTKRTIDELYNSISALCNQYGISLTEAKQAGLMGRIAGVSEKELLNFSNSEINKHVDCLKAALEKLSTSGKKIDIEEVIKLANNYNIAIHTGWSIKGFESHNQNPDTISERFSKYFGKKIDFSKMSEEEQYNLCREFFDKYFTELSQTEGPEKAAKLQLQTFGKLLINTPDEQKDIFRKAFASLLSENRFPALDATLKSFLTEEGRVDFADSITTQDLENAYSVDVQGNRPTNDQMNLMSDTVVRNQSEAGRKNFHENFEGEFKKFLTENKDILEIIESKIKNGEELTEEEQAIKDKLDNFFTPVSAGEFTGTMANQNISDEFRTEMMQTLNTDAYDKPNYRDVMAQVSEFIENHPETLTMSKEEFTNAMDKVTGGNYSTVVSDIKNGTTSELTPPSQASGYVPASTSNSSSSADFGFTVPEEPVNTVNPNQSKDRLYAQAAPVDEAPATAAAPQDILAAAQNTKTFSAFLKDNGAVTTVTEVFSNITHITNQGIINRATLLYKGLKQMQDDVLMAVNNSGLATLLPHTSDSTLKSLEGQTFANFDATRQVREACEELEA